MKIFLPIVVVVLMCLGLIIFKDRFSDDTIRILGPALIALSTVYLTSFLNGIAKAKEIKLTNYYRDRIDAVKTLYGLFMDLYYIHISLFNDKNKGLWGHYAYKADLKSWSDSFNLVRVFYSKNRILLLEESELSTKVRTNLELLSKIKKAISKERKSLTEIEHEFEGQLEYEYGFSEDNTEIEDIKARFAKFKADTDIAYIIGSFEQVRLDLEVYFKTLVS